MTARQIERPPVLESQIDIGIGILTFPARPTPDPERQAQYRHLVNAHGGPHPLAIGNNPDVESRTVSPVFRDVFSTIFRGDVFRSTIFRDVFRRVFHTRRRNIADQIEDWLEQWRD